MTIRHEFSLGNDPDHTGLEARTTKVLRLATMHRLVLQVLGPTYESAYLAFQQTVD